ncbi:hypothetical protein OF83DRAFT_1104435 [Amylostereum chailletii]|nr:hypothetical protein OF83DRAFT_1104435 [Amylostereum chailletii]
MSSSLVIVFQAPSPSPILSQALAGPSTLADLSIAHAPSGGSVDIVASTQITTRGDDGATLYRPYNSVLSSYPLLRGRSLVQPAAAIPDLKPLKLQAAMKERSGDDDRVCQYEAGGGECRDATCSSVHLSRLSVNPSDEDTARFLCGTSAQAERLLNLLGRARTIGPHLTFDERVGVAWTSMIEGRSSA